MVCQLEYSVMLFIYLFNFANFIYIYKNYILDKYIHTYIQKFILTRWPQQLRADFHEGREFRKKTYYTDRRFKIEQRKNNYYQDIINK